MLINNLIFLADSYKDGHDQMLPLDTQYIYSYLESRLGGQYDYTIFFGLQYILKKWLVGQVVTKEKIDEVEPILHEHFKQAGKVWNRSKWDYIIDRHGGYLPIKIKAVSEGSKIPVGNVLLTIENTDTECAWLTNYLESVLQQIWYPTSVCTRSYYIVEMLRKHLKQTADENMQWLADYQLHDFGQRGASCMEAAGIGGMAHLINSKGSDTKMAIPYTINYYNAKVEDLCYSVPASEHSIMCAEGEAKEFEVVKRLCKQFPNGILSVVSDSYDIDRAVQMYCTKLKDIILDRAGKFVIRLDSPRYKGERPADQIVTVVQTLKDNFGARKNNKGYLVLNPKVGVLYGDSLTEQQIEASLYKLKYAGFSTECCVYGCGGYLLQKLNRDTQRFAIKASAICRGNLWSDIYKKPKDESKISKKGKLSLISFKNEVGETKFATHHGSSKEDILQEVFFNGYLIVEQNFQEIRNRVKNA